MVKPGDYVYHLGDVWMGRDEERHGKLMNRLNGKKSLIVGNHDRIDYLCKGAWFRKVQMWKVFNEFNCLMTHVPIHKESIHERLIEEGGFNLHGHIHEKPSPRGPYFCACVEQLNYTPMNLEEVRDRMK